MIKSMKRREKKGSQAHSQLTTKNPSDVTEMVVKKRRS
jgi:hypothetical protein